jgi:hypothetical protein
VRLSIIVALVRRRKLPYIKRVRTKVGRKRCHIRSPKSMNMFGGGFVAKKDVVLPDGNQCRRKAKISKKTIPIQNDGREKVVREAITDMLSKVLPLLWAARTPRVMPIIIASIVEVPTKSNVFRRRSDISKEI